jgi:hypothetical protein
VTECTDTYTDVNNCGQCDNTSENSTCENGIITCTGTFAKCSGQTCSINLQSNIDHCGFCVSNPQNASSCTDGEYVCNTGFSRCSTNTCSFNLMNATNSVQNGFRYCGECGPEFVPPAGAQCVNGLVDCPGTFEQCPGSAACIDLATNRGHCGTCGTTVAESYCIDGAPTNSCTSPSVICPSTAFILRNDQFSPFNGYYSANVCLNLTDINTCGFKDGNNNCNVENCELTYPSAARPACCQASSGVSTYECADLDRSPTHCGNCATNCQTINGGVQRFCVNGQCSLDP